MKKTICALSQRFDWSSLKTFLSLPTLGCLNKIKGFEMSILKLCILTWN